MKLTRWSAAAGAAILSVAVLAEAASSSGQAGAASAATAANGSTASRPSASRATTRATSRSQQDRLFYSLGVLLSQNLTGFEVSEHEFRQVLQGLTDGFRHRAKFEDAQSLIPKIQALARARTKQVGAAFLAKVAATRGALRTPSGLVYVSSVQGTGAAPKVTDEVTVQYTGKLVDGTLFDSSLRRGQPATFPLAGIIPCWREALQLMRVGGKARVVCPSDLAYGDRGRPPVIPPGATLDFQIELLAVLPGRTVTPPPPNAK